SRNRRSDTQRVGLTEPYAHLGTVVDGPERSLSWPVLLDPRTDPRGSASPDVLDEPVGRAQPAQPRLGIGIGRRGALTEDVRQRPAHTGGDRGGVAAHEDDGALLQQVP